MLSDDFACTRVWESWQFGTMTQDDFVPLNETERVDELLALIQIKQLEELEKLELQLSGESRDKCVMAISRLKYGEEGAMFTNTDGQLEALKENNA